MLYGGVALSMTNEDHILLALYTNHFKKSALYHVRLEIANQEYLSIIKLAAKKVWLDW